MMEPITFNKTSGERQGRHNEIVWGVLIFLVALAFRLLYLAEMRDVPFFSHPRLDALFHDQWARSIAQGDLVGNTPFFRAPLYPYFLGFLYYLFGYDLVAVRIMQHVLGAATVVLTYLLARHYFDRITSALASLLCALYPVLIYFEGELLLESFLTFLLTGWMVAFSRLARKPTKRSMLWVGMLLGVVAITRPTMLPVGALLLGMVVWTLRRGPATEQLRPMATYALIGVALPILAVTVRNYVVSGDFVLIASQGGINFYIGNNPMADGFSSSLPRMLGPMWENRDVTFFVENKLGRSPTPAEESLYWYKEALAFVFSQPLQFSLLIIKKFYLFWSWIEIPNNHNYYLIRQYSSVLQGLPFGFGFLGSLSLVGLVIALKHQVLRPMVMFVVLFCLTTIAFFVCDRFRLPVIPVLCIFCSFTIVVTVRAVFSRNLKQVLQIVLLLIPSALLVNSTLVAIDINDSSRASFTLGVLALKEGEPEHAIDIFSTATSTGPGFPRLYIAWGIAEWMKGDAARAAELFHRELDLYPDSYDASISLAFLFEEVRQVDSMLHYARRSLNRKPYLPPPYILEAKAFLLLNKAEAAESILTEGARRCGEDFLYGNYLLAGLHFHRGRLDLADSLYRTVLKAPTAQRQPLFEPEFSFSLEEKLGENPIRLQAKAHYGLGFVFSSRGQPDSTLRYLEEATRIDTTFADGWADLGVAYLGRKNYSEARDALSKALQIEPTQHLYWFNLGVALDGLGLADAAENAFQQCLQLQPSFLPARNRLSR